MEMLMDSSQAEHSLLSSVTASERTLNPYVTGTSVVAIKYKDGILMAADMGGSYGYTLRYKSVERLKPVGKHSLLGASGEISDFQEILRYLDELILYDNMWDDGNSLGPKEVHSYLTRVMYNRRNKFNPLWNSLILGGVKNGQKYLGMVSMIGVNFEDNHVATGFGNHLARPILRDEWHDNLSFEDGVKLLEKCMRVLLYRDTTAVNKLQSSVDASKEMEYLRFDCTMMRLGIIQEFAPLEEHLKGQGFMEGGVLRVDYSSWKNPNFRQPSKSQVMPKSVVESCCNFGKIAKITEEGVTISQPYSLKTFWGYSAFQNPTVGAEGSW
uniref:Proteasome subunit beta n=1 Tax=Quercus lobata TaxID=97700 RepID=A0A7N2MSX2_QUELO